MKQWREGRRQQAGARRERPALSALCDGNEEGSGGAGGHPSLRAGKSQRLLSFSQQHKGVLE